MDEDEYSGAWTRSLPSSRCSQPHPQRERTFHRWSSVFKLTPWHPCPFFFWGCNHKGKETGFLHKGLQISACEDVAREDFVLFWHRTINKFYCQWLLAWISNCRREKLAVFLVCFSLWKYIIYRWYDLHPRGPKARQKEMQLCSRIHRHNCWCIKRGFFLFLNVCRLVRSLIKYFRSYSHQIKLFL